jgi:hypothetical protein
MVDSFQLKDAIASRNNNTYFYNLRKDVLYVILIYLLHQMQTYNPPKEENSQPGVLTIQRRKKV